MTDCYFEKKDWRACKKEVSCSALSPPTPRASPNTFPHSTRPRLCRPNHRHQPFCYISCVISRADSSSSDGGIPGVLEKARKRPAHRDEGRLRNATKSLRHPSASQVSSHSISLSCMLAFPVWYYSYSNIHLDSSVAAVIGSFHHLRYAIADDCLCFIQFVSKT